MVGAALDHVSGSMVYEPPPNGQGIAALMLLNFARPRAHGLVRPQLRRGAPPRIAAKKLAYADMARDIRDLALHHVPVEAMEFMEGNCVRDSGAVLKQ